MSVSSIPTLDLFAGAGGLSLGFEQADQAFLPVLAVEHDESAAETYATNFGCEVYAGPIEDLTEFPEARVIVGGPPCQGFSPLGRDRDAVSRARLNALWEHYLRAVRDVEPEAFVVENVPEFLKSAEFQVLLRTLEEDPAFAAYHPPAFGVLNAADYGVPQLRRRGVMIVSRVRDPRPLWPPAPTHNPATYATVREAIGDLPLTPTNEDLHWGRNPKPFSIERYRAVPEGGNRFDLARNRPDLLPDCWRRKKSGTTDVFGRLWWDRPAFTIRTEFFKPEKGRYLHPQADRPITHREAARLQTFPDSFAFVGSKISVARQIGNAVPPLLARRIAEVVAQVVSSDIEASLAA
ncbi:DNA cytosine methyltransferase [Miltoncostaea marina]|uniref:DNA cytosine methyltransferase n=1 Tax=Miltoncostaea marina TaxID=2843215 RepID=UPI001C3C77CA|nr:DNA cytosine methyltransferase [Miltoncostaea marina]